MIKKILRGFILVAVFALVVPVAQAASLTPKVVSAADKARAEELTQRLEELRGLDTKNMTRKEKKALRTEVKAIKKEMAAISGGVYLSVGAILLIALLLILLL